MLLAPRRLTGTAVAMLLAVALSILLATPGFCNIDIKSQMWGKMKIVVCTCTCTALRALGCLIRPFQAQQVLLWAGTGTRCILITIELQSALNASHELVILLHARTHTRTGQNVGWGFGIEMIGAMKQAHLTLLCPFRLCLCLPLW